MSPSCINEIENCKVAWNSVQIALLPNIFYTNKFFEISFFSDRSTLNRGKLIISGPYLSYSYCIHLTPDRYFARFSTDFSAFFH